MPLRTIFSVIMVLSIKKYETKYALVQVAKRGNNAFGCPVVSSANTIEVRKALEAPANIADIPTNTESGIVIPTSGNQNIPTLPNNAPIAPPIVSNGANVPPEVPLPNEIAQDKNFSKQRDSITCIGILPDSRSVIFS